MGSQPGAGSGTPKWVMSAIRRTSGTNKRRDAERLAAKWEKDLSEGKGSNRSRITWEEFRLRYEDEVCGSLADGTGDRIASVFNVLERAMKPRLLANVDEDLLSRHQAWLRGHGREESTIKSHLAHIVAALRWAVDQKMLHVAPKVKMPKRAKRSKVMKGRPITLEEFERLEDKVPAGVLSQHVREERRAAIASHGGSIFAACGHLDCVSKNP